MSGYLAHHGFRKGQPEASRTEGPPCSVCYGPMLVGQRKRHITCSPVLACCGAHEDAIGDLMKHAQGHVNAEAERDLRFEQRADYDPGPRDACICLKCHAGTFNNQGAQP